MKKTNAAPLLALLLVLQAPGADAARPMTTDDAYTLEPRQCQLETWRQHGARQTDYWAVPSCNFGGGWELAAGAARVYTRTTSGSSSLGLVQAKTTLNKSEDGIWALGLTLADQLRPGAGANGDLSVNVPLSVQLAGDRLLAHANLGWLRERAQPGQRTWALGLEAAAGERTAVTVEGYGTRLGGAFVQIGVRHTVLAGRADLDAGYGERAGLRGRERYFAFGLTLYAGLD